MFLTVMGTEHKLTFTLLSDSADAGVRVQRGWWHEVLYRFPRSAYKTVAAADEMKSSGVYFLLGEAEGKPFLYVGQTTNLSARFAQHAVDGSKGFWQETLVLTTAGGATLDEAHLKYLENHFYCIAVEAGRCTLVNSSVPPESVAVDSIRQDMDECIAHTRLLLNLMGYHFLEKQEENNAVEPQEPKALPVPAKPRAKKYDFYEMGLRNGDVLVYEDKDPAHRTVATVCSANKIKVNGEVMTPHALAARIRGVNNVYAFAYLFWKGEKLGDIYNRLYHPAAGQGAADGQNLRYCTVAGADAVGRLTEGGGIVVLKGSRICSVTQKSCPKPAVALRANMAPETELKKDMAFTSLSAAAAFVGGSSLSGTKYWTETRKIPKPRKRR